MKKALTALAVAAAVSCLAFSGFAAEAPKAEPKKAEPKKAAPAAAGKGEALFKQHCTMCHPDGGNIVNPKKTLHAKDLKANRITKPEDIVKVMRTPGPGMTPFDAKTIPDKDAMEIARYVLNTFK